jgi:hypothetical protein
VLRLRIVCGIGSWSRRHRRHPPDARFDGPFSVNTDLKNKTAILFFRSAAT